MLAKVFRNGQSQAVRIPKNFRFNTNEVFIKKIGDDVVLSPKKNTQEVWKDFFDSLNEFSPDFCIERQQVHQQREKLF